MEARLHTFEIPPDRLLGVLQQTLAAGSPGWLGDSKDEEAYTLSQAHGLPLTCPSNKFSPLINTPTVEKSLVIGSSIVRNMTLETPVIIVKCIPRARAGNVESYIKLLD